MYQSAKYLKDNGLIELYLIQIESLEGYCNKPNRYNKYKKALGYWLNKDCFDDICKAIQYVPDKSKLTDVKWHTKTKNKIVIDRKENCAKLYLRNVRGEVNAESFIDFEDVPRVFEYKWSLETAGTGYAMCGSIRTKLHRFLLNITDVSIHVDHINGKSLDNRKKNIRATNNYGNMQNIKMTSVNKTGVVGVSVYSGKYRVRIKNGKVEVHIGMFDNFKDAVVARLKAELKYYGEFGPNLHLCDEYGVENPFKHMLDIKSTEPCLFKAIAMKRLLDYKMCRGN